MHEEKSLVFISNASTKGITNPSITTVILLWRHLQHAHKHKHKHFLSLFLYLHEGESRAVTLASVLKSAVKISPNPLTPKIWSLIFLARKAWSEKYRQVAHRDISYLLSEKLFFVFGFVLGGILIVKTLCCAFL